MSRVVHVIGNGDSADLYNNKERKGLKLTCNLPPFPVENVYGSCIVDFKMMKAITEGVIDVPGEWILGYRPKIWMEKHPDFYMRRATQIKEFFTKKPEYVANYTDFNCGHMAVYYAIKKFNPTEINIYGFDSIFDMNLRSSSDFFMISDRQANNNVRLNGNWRPIWYKLFNEFNSVNFKLHHFHNNIKFGIGDNVEIITYGKK